MNILLLLVSAYGWLAFAQMIRLSKKYDPNDQDPGFASIGILGSVLGLIFLILSVYSTVQLYSDQ